MPFSPSFKSLAGVVAVLTMTVACTREIGDGCTTGTDCSQTGGRTCDTTMPGGYCTIPNCEPDSCPEEAACIGFYTVPSTATQCSSLHETRGLRPFCMRRCSSQDDCRGGYICADLNSDGNPWGAKRLDFSSIDGRVCALPYTALPAVEVEGTRADYCTAGPYVDSGYYAVGGSTGFGQNSAGSAGTAGAPNSSASAGSAGTAGTSGASSEAGSAGDAGQSGSFSGGGTSGASSDSP